MTYDYIYCGMNIYRCKKQWFKYDWLFHKLHQYASNYKCSKNFTINITQVYTYMYFWNEQYNTLVVIGGKIASCTTYMFDGDWWRHLLDFGRIASESVISHETPRSDMACSNGSIYVFHNLWIASIKLCWKHTECSWCGDISL